MAVTMQRIETYSGQYDFNVWFQKFEMVLRITKIQVDDKLDYLMTHLEMSIFKAVLSAIPTDRPRKFDDVGLVDFLRKRYSTQDKYLDRLDFFSVRFSETFDEFAVELESHYELFETKFPKTAASE